MKNSRILEAQLKEYARGKLYPLHMPGHKRRLDPVEGLSCALDMTEVEGMDDLHGAEGILKEAMDRTAELWGAEKSWYLVNGSTCGILAAVRAAAPMGGEIIAARNCHKSVYHAIELGALKTSWLIPPIDREGIYGSVPPEEVRRALEQHPKAACVVITSPTYEGVISDIRSIGGICRERGVPLIVDEAHGAHLGLFPGWPPSAVRLGADIVVQSCHKTLPSLTQTALLHLGENSLISPDEAERQLDIFETSSPSYLLMASLDGCTGIIREKGEELFRRWREGLDAFGRAIAPLEKLSVICHGSDGPHGDFFAFDPGKLPVSCINTGFTGPGLAGVLRERFSFELEMACGSIALAMTGLGDEKEALTAFGEALAMLDRETSQARFAPMTLPPPGETVYTIADARLLPSEELLLAAAAGAVAGEYIWAYPPGVPICAPGERITGELTEAVKALEGTGTVLRRSHGKKPGCIQVIS